ncbi:MAG TPA: cyclic nucleotide-binding domain-containing protein, partial [Pyrinomonadaceae bacterium]
MSKGAGERPAGKTSAGAGSGAADARDWWPEATVRWAALAVFVAVPVGALFFQNIAGRAVWTVAVAALPLFIVLIGYHRWRRVCPLAFFAQLPAKLWRAGRLKAPAWLEENYYYAVVGVFTVSLWLRLVATNGDGQALSTFFTLLALAAFASGFVFTGKTWCNHLCPVSFVEKVYTEPHGLRETANSQCAKCTACKKFCPDISEENGYWKEIGSRPKRLAYYAFPGLVFGFYFYYYLQSGTWSYYFGGGWTDEPRLFASAFLPGVDRATAGFFFYPQAPRALASLLTLAACGLVSFALFLAAERRVGAWLRARGREADEDQARHVTFSLAAFSAFLLFYTFAGAPTLWKLPWAVPHVFLILVVLTATASLLRRLGRTRQRFAEETLARNIVKRWEWADQAPPKDLREAFLVHTARASEGAKTAAGSLLIYKEAVQEAISDGLVSRDEVQKLERLRGQLNIKKADHDKVMTALASDDRALLGDPTRHLSAEKCLQLKSYESALEAYVGRASADEDLTDGRSVSRLRGEYRVTGEEHDAVLDRLLGGKKVLSARLAEELHVIERAAATVAVLGREPSPLRDFLSHLLRRRRATAIERLLNVLGLAADEENVGAACRKLQEEDRLVRQSAFRELSQAAAPAVADYLNGVQLTVADYADSALDDLLVTYAGSVDPYVRATAALMLYGRGTLDSETLERLRGDEHAAVREVVASVEAGRGGKTAGGGEPSTIEKMAALHSVALFSTLAPEELEELALACRSESYPAGAVICEEGVRGDDVFIILEGDARVTRRGDGSPSLVSVEGAGGVFGEMAVLDPAPRAATVTAGDGGARTLRVVGASFMDALHSDPSIASGLLKVMARRLRGGASAGASDEAHASVP